MSSEKPTIIRSTTPIRSFSKEKEDTNIIRKKWNDNLTIYIDEIEII